jgi:hypothetical protein
MEKATLIPFSYRGSGSAFRSQNTSWFPSASRLEGFEGVGRGFGIRLVVGATTAFGLDLAALDGLDCFLGLGELYSRG